MYIYSFLYFFISLFSSKSIFQANYGGGVYANGLNQLNIEDIVSTGDNAGYCLLFYYFIVFFLILYCSLWILIVFSSFLLSLSFLLPLAHGGFLWAEEISTFEIALSTISECQVMLSI